MMAKIRRLFSYKFFPIAWTIFTIILLCLPGSIVPGTGIFSIKHLDKIVHVILFGLNVIFWGWHYQSRLLPAPKLRTRFIVTAGLVSALGIAMEYVQLYFIPNRSFDTGDIAADIAGAALAAVWLIKN